MGRAVDTVGVSAAAGHMNNSDIEALIEHVRALPGVARDQDSTDEDPGFRILDGFLATIADFEISTPERLVLLRCSDEDHERYVGRGGEARVSERMRWETDGWKWIDVLLGPDADRTAVEGLIDGSYRICLESSSEDVRMVVDLLRRNATPEQALEEMIVACKLGDLAATARAWLRTEADIVSCRYEAQSFSRSWTAIGGEPQTPVGGDWPTARDGRPMSFVARVDLAEVHGCSGPSALPSSGVLLFFVAFEDPTELEPSSEPSINDDGSVDVCVRLVDKGSVDGAGHAPNERGIEFCRPACYLTRRAWLAIPVDWEGEYAIEDSVAAGDDLSRLEDLFKTFAGFCSNRETRHSLLGPPRFGQLPHEEVQYDSTVLLFQLEYDTAAGLHIFDGGTVQFWIDRSDLERRDFSRVLGVTDSL